MNRLIKVFLLLLIPFLIGAADFGDYTTLIKQKMETEKRLESHLGSIVKKIVGEKKSMIIVSVDVADLQRRHVKTEQWLEKEKENTGIKLKRQEEFLPGIPLRTNLEETEVKQSPERSGGKKIEDIITLPAKFIKSIKVSLILDKSIPDETVATVENILNDILDLNPAKGDRLIIKRVDFAGRSLDILGWFFNPYFYVIVLVLITLTILTLFLFGPLKKFLFATLQTLKDLKGIKSETEYSGGAAVAGGVGASMGGEGEIEIEEEEGIEKTVEGETIEGELAEGEEKKEEEFEKMTYKPLNFLENKDLKKLAYLLNFEKPEVIALLIDYLEPGKGAKVLTALPIEKRTLVAKSIVKIQRSSKEILVHIDEFLSKKIDYVSGGADKLVGFIEMMNEEDRDTLMDSLSTEDPEFADKVREQMFSFADIINLDDGAIQMLIQEMETRDLGISLKNVSEDIKEKFVSNMSEGAAALLKEEIEFGRKVTDSQIKTKQMDIIARIKRMESEGLISGVTGAGSKEFWVEELGEGEKEGVLEHIISAAQNALKEKESLEAGHSGEPNDDIAFNYYEQGLEVYKEEKYEDAIKFFNQSIKYNPSVWQTYQYIGSCYLALDDEINAKESYNKSIELNPDNAELKEWVEAH